MAGFDSTYTEVTEARFFAQESSSTHRFLWVELEIPIDKTLREGQGASTCIKWVSVASVYVPCDVMMSADKAVWRHLFSFCKKPLKGRNVSSLMGAPPKGLSSALNALSWEITIVK